jgi:uncharacterized protein (DUF433 family)
MRVVRSLEDVVRNIRTYGRDIARHPGLAQRVKQHPAWYAVKDEDGRWLFGPSKFVGYVDANANDYLAAYNRKDGKETEPALARWFEPVAPQTALGRQLRTEFERFAETVGKTPNARWRVSVPQDVLVASRGSSLPKSPDARIAFDPDICGGRPRIRGTRVRVSDIVAAIADGETVDDLIADYPYLSAEDISAALRYAAGAVDHRVLIAA